MPELEKFFDTYPLDGEVAAVGVSGGADSLALVYLMQEWAQQKHKRIVALTVNHGLRPEAGAEAEYVAKLMKKAKIEHHILLWQGEKPENGVEEAAREARYALLGDWCAAHGVKSLVIAHHRRDQAETFLMRLQRGSGVDGLSGMAPVSFRGELRIMRPLLETNPEELRDYLKKRNIRWVEDPSNGSDDYLRVRIRKLLPELEEKIGLTTERLSATAVRMGRVRDYLDKQSEKFIRSHGKSWSDCAYSLSYGDFSSLHEEIALRVLSGLLKKVGNRIYAPRLDDLQRLYLALREDDYRTRTLSGCEILRRQNKIWIVPELKGVVGLSKKQWEEFCALNPVYQKMKLPYKLKLVLFKQTQDF